MTADARARLIALAGAPEGKARLAEAALWIAAEEYTDLDVPRWLGRLHALGREAAARISPRMDADETAVTLGAFLFGEERFRGNEAEYYDPRNSFLNEVLARRLGIPITLSIVYMDVAARAGVGVRGVGLPGHFIVRLTHRGATRLVDPFNGGVTLTEAECEALLGRLYGPDARLDPAHLAPLGTRAILTRMLGNLKGIYARQGDWGRALRAAERIVELAPDALGELRDRGLIRAKLGQTQAAIRDWERYLAAAPEAPDAAAVRAELRALRQSLAILN